MSFIPGISGILWNERKIPFFCLIAGENQLIFSLRKKRFPVEVYLGCPIRESAREDFHDPL